MYPYNEGNPNGPPHTATNQKQYAEEAEEIDQPVCMLVNIIVSFVFNILCFGVFS